MPRYDEDYVEASRGRRRRDQVDEFANSSGPPTSITSILTLHKNRGHIRDAEIRKIVPEFNDKLRQNISRKIEKAFGLELAIDPASRNMYLLSKVRVPPTHSIFSTELRKDVDELSNEEAQHYMEDSLLLVVLMIVLMNSTPPSQAYPKGSGLRLSTLASILEEANLIPPVELGPLSKFVDGNSSSLFVARGWLSSKETALEGEKHFNIYWGPLAEAVVRPMHILRLYCTLVQAVPKEFVDIHKYAQSVDAELGPCPVDLFAQEESEETDEDKEEMAEGEDEAAEDVEMEETGSDEDQFA
ncbi:hypothetical protein L596_007765 [Steinernema carpocapsae]|uniref:MAGE domain-containing protein n=1 Tax=Steinernema carpocapsae TaxID=34508 RepID=A0A4U5PAC4_STECR|nr:hypothetical protein L596_007765 [Steinernema carpocapsae]